MVRRLSALLAAAVLIVAFASSASAQASALKRERYVAPYNLVIINLDASVSFQIPSNEEGVKGRVLAAEALGVVQQIFRAGGEARQRRTDGIDHYVLVAVDAASQVIWRGTRDELRQISPGVLSNMLAPRRQFAQCTDIGAAFEADLGEMRRDSRATKVYILTFSDLINDPPTTSWKTCGAPSGTPPDVPWKDFANADLSFYFVSTDFKLRPAARWRAALERDGLQAVFLDSAQTMSKQVEVAPPKVAAYQPSAEDVRQADAAVARMKSGAAFVAKAVAGGLGVGLLILVAYVVAAARRRRPRTT